MATTLALPSALNIGNDDLKPLIRKAEARTVDKPPYEVLDTYERYDYDLGRQYSGEWLKSNPPEDLHLLHTPGWTDLEVAFSSAAQTYAFGNLTQEHAKLRVEKMVLEARLKGASEDEIEEIIRTHPYGPTYSGGAWFALYPGIWLIRGKYTRMTPQYRFNSPAEASKVVKKVARFYGADIVGIAKLDERWFFKRQAGYDIVFEDVEQPYRTNEKFVIPKKCKWLIVMGLELDYYGMKTFNKDGIPTMIEPATTTVGYGRMGIQHTMLAEFIRNLGYIAIPHGNDTSLSIPIAIDAGLANCSRCGLGSCPEYGPAVRWSKVLTDLPLEPDGWEDFGTTNFCSICHKCCRECPGGAIPSGERTTKPPDKHFESNPGVKKWYVDHAKCRRIWEMFHNDCGICISVCPFNKGGEAWPHDVSRWFIENLPALNSLWPWLDDALGYGTGIDPDEWWENRPVTWAHGTRRPKHALRPQHEP